MKTAKKGDWVQISNVVLPAGDRAPQVPEDTQKTNLMMWVKGYAQADAAMGETVEVVTTTGRHITGKLTAVNPGYIHTYGSFVPELNQIQKQLRELMGFGGVN